MSAWRAPRGASSPRRILIPDDPETIHWVCQSDHTDARAILAQMEGVNVDASIRYFQGRMAGCDCELLFNLEEGSDE